MKTPREILLQRHAAAAPKLDALRRAAVRELNHQETKEQRFPVFFVTWFLCCSEKVWQELVWPCRRTWAGLAAVWVVLAVFNATHAERGQTGFAKSSPPAAMRFAFLEQQRLLTEIIGPAAPEPPAEPPQQPRNQPRSERRIVSMCG